MKTQITEEERKAKMREAKRRSRAKDPERNRDVTMRSVAKWRAEHPDLAAGQNRQAQAKKREKNPAAATKAVQDCRAKERGRVQFMQMFQAMSLIANLSNNQTEPTTEE